MTAMLAATALPPADGGPPVRPARGRWTWTALGLLVTGALASGLTALAVLGGTHGNAADNWVTRSRTTTVADPAGYPITGVNVASSGGQIRVTASTAHRVLITEQYQSPDGADDPSGLSSTVSGGVLTIAEQDCCLVGVTVTLPAGVPVTAQSDGGNVVVTGTAGANVDSGGGTVTARAISGPVTISSESGAVSVTGVSGPVAVFSDDGAQHLASIRGTVNSLSGGGSVTAEGITGASATFATQWGPLSASGLDVALATATTNGENARLAFTAPPAQVSLSTGGGQAVVQVPSGPYAVTADSDGGPQAVHVPTSGTARHALTVLTSGGGLAIEGVAPPAAGEPAANGVAGSAAAG